jgi:spermidine/putrescine transport system permease protein
MAGSTGFAPTANRLPDRRRPLPTRIRTAVLPVYTGLVVMYLFLPIVVMAVFGFNDIQGRFNFTWQGFTLEHWANLFNRYPALNQSLFNSLTVAVISTLVATTFGTLIGLALTRYEFRGRGPLNLLIFLPIATPEIVLGASLLALFVSAGVSRDLTTITIAHIMFNISFVVVTIRARLAGFNRFLEEAGMDLYADGWTTFRKVTFPIIFPGVLAAALLAFALSIDDYVITLFSAGRTLTFPLWVVGASRVGIPPEVNVLGTLILLIAFVFIAVQTWAGRRQGQREAGPVTLVGR